MSCEILKVAGVVRVVSYVNGEVRSLHLKADFSDHMDVEGVVPKILQRGTVHATVEVTGKCKPE